MVIIFASKRFMCNYMFLIIRRYIIYENDDGWFYTYTMHIVNNVFGKLILNILVLLIIYFEFHVDKKLYDSFDRIWKQ